MTLQEQLNAYRNDPNHQLPPEAQSLLDAHIDALKNTIENYGLRHGEKAPDFTFSSSNQVEDHLYNYLNEGPLILTFVRGDWCSYCNLQLKAYETMMTKLTEKRAKLMVVSLQADEKEQNYAHLQFIKDTTGAIAKSYKVLYPIEAQLAQVYKNVNIDLALKNTDGQWHLPITATFIIDQKALIRHTFIDTDFRNRMEPDSILAILNIIS